MATATTEKPRLTFPRIVRSEWIKFRTLRSPAWTLSIGVLVMVGFGLLMAVAFSAAVAQGAGGEVSDEIGVTFGGDGIGMGTVVSTMGLQLAQLAVATLGVLIITGEYATGMIRSTLVAVPQRLPVLWAKASVFAVVAFLTGVAGAFVTYFATLPILRGAHLDSSLANPEVVRILVGSGLYLGAIGVLAMAIGAIFRNAAAGIGVSVALLVLMPGLVSLIPGELPRLVLPYLPSNAGQRLINEVSETATLGPWEGFGVLIIWTVAALAVAATLLRRKDA